MTHSIYGRYSELSLNTYWSPGLFKTPRDLFDSRVVWSNHPTATGILSILVIPCLRAEQLNQLSNYNLSGPSVVSYACKAKQVVEADPWCGEKCNLWRFILTTGITSVAFKPGSHLLCTSHRCTVASPNPGVSKLVGTLMPWNLTQQGDRGWGIIGTDV